MSDDVKHLEDELFEATEEDDVSTDAEITSQDDESSNLIDDLPPKEKAEQQFVDSWAKKIAAGEATLEELQAKQPWLVPKVKTQLGDDKQVDKDDLRKLAREEAEKLFQEKSRKEQEASERQSFEKLRSTLNSLALTPSQKEVIKSKYSSLIGKLSSYEALQLAAEVAQVDYEDTDTARKQVGSPKVGGGVKDSDISKIDLEKIDPNSLTPEQRRQYIASQR